MLEAPDWLSEGQRQMFDLAVAVAPAGVLLPIDQSIVAMWATLADRIRICTEACAKSSDPEAVQLYEKVISETKRILADVVEQLGFDPGERRGQLH